MRGGQSQIWRSTDPSSLRTLWGETLGAGTLCHSKGILHGPKRGCAELLLIRVHGVVVREKRGAKQGARCHKPRGQPGTILPQHGKGDWPQRALLSLACARAPCRTSSLHWALLCKAELRVTL